MFEVTVDPITAEFVCAIDHFNLQPIILALTPHGPGEERDAPIAVERPYSIPKGTPLSRKFICSQCGVTVKRDITFDMLQSPTGVDTFCKIECAQRFRKSDLRLNIIDADMLDCIARDLVRTRDTYYVARSRNVSHEAVRHIHATLSTERHGPAQTNLADNTSIMIG